MAEDGETGYITSKNAITLIRLVKQHPALWDTRKPRMNIKEAWSTVVTSLFPDSATADQKKITENVKKEWSRVREQYKKCWKNGNVYTYRGHDMENELKFLIPVFKEKEKQQSSFSDCYFKKEAGQSNILLGTSNCTVDPDAETVFNDRLCKKEPVGESTSNDIFEIESSDSFSSLAEETESAKTLHRTDPIKSAVESINRDTNFVLKKLDNLQTTSGNGQTVDELIPNNYQGNNETQLISPLPMQLLYSPNPPSPPASRSTESPKHEIYNRSNNSKGIKRPFGEEYENCDEEQHLLHLVESFTNKFNCSQNTDFSLGILPLLQSHLSKGSNLSNEEIKDFNSRILRVILCSIKNLDMQERLSIIAKIICCAEKASSRE